MQTSLFDRTDSNVYHLEEDLGSSKYWIFEIAHGTPGKKCSNSRIWKIKNLQPNPKHRCVIYKQTFPDYKIFPCSNAMLHGIWALWLPPHLFSDLQKYISYMIFLDFWLANMHSPKPNTFPMSTPNNRNDNENIIPPAVRLFLLQ